MKRRDFFVAAGAASIGSMLGRKTIAAPCPVPGYQIDSGPNIPSACLPPAALPQYMAGMNAFDVRHLTSVSNGLVTMFSALPGEWQTTGQTAGADNVFYAWSGGAGDPKGKRLFVHGGGHYDSSNNGLYVFDFNGDGAPAGWSVAPNSLSARSAVVESANTYADGKPTSIHSYDGMWYDEKLNRFYRFGGSGFGPSGGGISAAFYYSFSSASWVPFVDSSSIATTLGSTLVGSPDGTQVLYLASTKSPLFVNTSTKAITASGSQLSGSEESGFATAMDTNRSNLITNVCRYVSFYKDSSGARAKLITVNWPAKTFTVSTQTLSGSSAADLSYSGACVLYDSQRDAFWVFANSGETGDGTITGIYEVNAATFAVTRHALNGTISSKVNNKGGYNRHVWFSDWRIIGTVHSHDKPVSLIKLP